MPNGKIKKPITIGIVKNPTIIKTKPAIAYLLVGNKLYQFIFKTRLKIAYASILALLESKGK
jgi:hypothetical protein